MRSRLVARPCRASTPAGPRPARRNFLPAEVQFARRPRRMRASRENEEDARWTRSRTI